MSTPQTASRDILSFIKQTISQEEANDPDIVEYIRLVSEKKIKSQQKDEETIDSLKQVLKDEKAINQLVTFFNDEKKRISDEDNKKKQKKDENTPKPQLSGKAVVNKSQSDIPEIYREMDSLKSKTKKEYPQKKRESEPKIKHQKHSQSNQQHKNKNQHKSNIFDRFGNQDETKPMTKNPVKKQKVDSQGNPQITLKPNLEDKTKCKFFPFCTNQQCQFFHPTQKCPHFPKCRFKEKCLFVHEACKFGQSCTRPDCFYDHPLKNRKSNNPLLNMMKMMMSGNMKNMVKKPKKPFNKGEQKQQQHKQEGQQNQG